MCSQRILKISIHIFKPILSLQLRRAHLTKYAFFIFSLWELCIWTLHDASLKGIFRKQCRQKFSRQHNCRQHERACRFHWIQRQWCDHRLICHNVVCLFVCQLSWHVNSRSFSALEHSTKTTQATKLKKTNSFLPINCSKRFGVSFFVFSLVDLCTMLLVVKTWIIITNYIVPKKEIVCKIATTRRINCSKKDKNY